MFLCWKYILLKIHLIVGISHINLHYTDEINGNGDVFPHTCLYMNVHNDLSEKSSERIRFCLSEFLSTNEIKKAKSFSKLTFSQMAKQSITSEQLYYWSASIDLIEEYQFYLNKLSMKNEDLSLGETEFSNCTLPNFGHECQYEFVHDIFSYSSLDESIENYYKNLVNDPQTLTCYVHIKCNRGSSLICLHWREICDGKVDCLDNEIDEDHCWEIEINECLTNEYRCRNGQCIPISFSQDDFDEPDCLDVSDEPTSPLNNRILCHVSDGPWFRCEDTSTLLSDERNDHLDIRRNLLMKLIYSNKDSSLTENCSRTLICLMNVSHLEYSSSSCDDLHENIENFCPKLIYFPNIPVLFGHIYFLYKTNEFHSQRNSSSSSIPFYICSNQSDYTDYLNKYPSEILNNMRCVHLQSLFDLKYLSYYSTRELHQFVINSLNQWMRSYHLTSNSNCNRTNIYQCRNSSKCISISRLMDGIKDCRYEDDENIRHINLNQSHFNCLNGKYISQSLVEDSNCDCDLSESVWCPDEHIHITFLKRNLVFQHLCDGFVDLQLNENDESYCEEWECDNIYTHCNGIWNCLNGADEINCDFSLNCSSKFHRCVLPDTNQLICLSLEKFHDGNVDCLGGTDEPELCGRRSQSTENRFLGNDEFYCRNSTNFQCISLEKICDEFNNCQYGDDEQFCSTNLIELDYGKCVGLNYEKASNVEQFLCDYQLPGRIWKVIDFKLDQTMKYIEKTIPEKTLTSTLSVEHQFQHCHRGLDVNISMSRKGCFCPSSYYGPQCQYENQRISLTIEFHVLAGSYRTPFAVIISLIDDSDERVIHSYEQITYLSIRDCQMKFKEYFLYSTRPKDSMRNYSIHIDFYEKNSLKYRGSALLLIPWTFLPVHRLSFIVNIPRIDENQMKSCSIDRCKHGQCIQYSNQRENVLFCQCHHGWSGKSCHIPHKCNCSPDSLCVGISANNRSICICPKNRFGPRCLLTDTICEKSSNFRCECIPNHYHRKFFENFSCICQKNSTGNRCEILDNQLILTFEKDLHLPQLIFFHFIEIVQWHLTKKFTKRTTTFRSTPLRQDSIVVVYWSEPFHLVFTELEKKKYYLTVKQSEYNRSSIIQRRITSQDYCPNISELFNQTFLRLSLLRRMKFYHLPCQNQSLNLECFHDEIHLCLCYQFYQQKRLANCFQFDHQMKFDCFGQSECQNDAQCYQNKIDCPTKSWCICPPCYYGQLCQFSTTGFHSSLDGILGYHILSDVSLVKQPFIVKISFVLTMIYLVIGLTDGFLCLITFKNKTICDIGCGLYLLFCSIITLVTMILFGLKYFLLLLTQMTTLSNRSFLQLQCHLLDFLLQVCLSMNQWLNTCVAVERTMMLIKGVRFDKTTSRKTAKFVLIILFIIIVGNYIHDPISRHLIDEDNDIDDTKRTWCIIRYSANLRIYNHIIHTAHICGPFLISLISVFTLIRIKAQHQTTVRTHRTYKQLLLEQFQELKHLLTAPIALILLTLPRFLTTFLSKCMQSPNDAWLFLIGYFISFIPSMLTFVIFVIPSQFYKQEFHNAIRKYRRIIQQHLYGNRYY